MHLTLTRLHKVQFFRNVMGAILGAALAMMLYGMYHMGRELLSELQHVPATATVQDLTDTARNQKLIETAARAKQIAEELH